MPSIKIQLLVFSFYYVNWGMGCVIYIFAQLHSNVLKLVIHQNTYTTLHYHTHALLRPPRCHCHSYTVI